MSKKVTKSWTEKIVEPKKIKQDGKPFKLVKQEGMRLVKDGEST